ncbi:MAG: hypothetical protein JSW56_10085 [Deltaproteobacteria bacterium]|nr:MAG: hypothetical protein JSW56_10085 [Deltaproteobacteria bacterium]
MDIFHQPLRASSEEWRTGEMEYWILKWKEFGLAPSHPSLPYSMTPSLREGDERKKWSINTEHYEFFWGIYNV